MDFWISKKIIREITDVEEAKALKLRELSTACNATIIAGGDVQLTGGIERFAYKIEDQTNISQMFGSVVLGMTEYPYQATDGSCTIYSAADIVAIHTTLAGLKTATLTYYHHLKDYVSSLIDIDSVLGVTWGQPLEGEYLAGYNIAMETAQQQLQVLLSKIGGATGA